MITEAIINILMFLPNTLLDGIEGVSLSIPDNVFNGLNDLFGCLGFIFPISGLMIILGVSFAIKCFQIIWSVFIRIKSFIPFMGD